MDQILQGNILIYCSIGLSYGIILVYVLIILFWVIMAL